MPWIAGALGKLADGVVHYVAADVNVEENADNSVVVLFLHQVIE